MRVYIEIFFRFLALGCVSFGGPAAHIGYFRNTFVQKLKWLDEATYAGFISLSQFLPGPASSQTGFAIGLHRGGPLGGLAAFLGFTTPSVLLMILLSQVEGQGQAARHFAGVVHGLKLLAVVVVAQATLSMFGVFCKTRLAAGLAVFTAAGLLCIPGLWTQMGVLAAAAVIGARFGTPELRNGAAPGRLGRLPLILFFALFLVLPLLAGASSWLWLFARFYHAGSLVFGGGHVVLPLLQETIGDAVATDRFLLGYAAAQGVPGPMFSLTAFLGAELMPGAPRAGALVAAAGVFLPGFLLIMALKDTWVSLAARPGVAGAAWGINAAVVGLLLAALYRPVFLSAVAVPHEMAAVLVGFFALHTLKTPIVVMVITFALLGLALGG